MIKDLTLGKLAGYISIGTAITYGLVYLFIDLLNLRWPYIIALFLVVVYCIFLFVRYLLDRFVFRKIKLIYKTISRTKNSIKNTSAAQSRLASLSEVNREVEEWMTNKESEIAALNELEIYRRNYLGNISHELKTPIFAVQGYIHTLLDGGINDDRIKIKYLHRAAKNVDRLQSIVEDLETINKLESGQLLLNMRIFDIKTLSLDIFEELRVLAEEKSITLDFKQGARKSFRVNADESKIRQVITNLLTNGIKYGRKGGVVLVGFYDMHVNVLIEVSDDGIGMATEHLKHVFDRFYRIDHSGNRMQGGSGLGLAIAKHIIEAHHQTINVRSTKDKGTTFGFTLEKAGK